MIFQVGDLLECNEEQKKKRPSVLLVMVTGENPLGFLLKFWLLNRAECVFSLWSKRDIERVFIKVG